ncbi:hypothetical protein MJT46_005245 [Ovis ammon polii x Ovis aries]|nr:hypothetical protein MJT46_005245 [Ovis ammon polii x Ovis aries]
MWGRKAVALGGRREKISAHRFGTQEHPPTKGLTKEPKAPSVTGPSAETSETAATWAQKTRHSKETTVKWVYTSGKDTDADTESTPDASAHHTLHDDSTSHKYRHLRAGHIRMPSDLTLIQKCGEDGSSRRTVRDGDGRPSHEPWSEEELPTARSQELNTAQLRIAVNCNAHVERKQGPFSGSMWPGQAARSKAGLGQMILAEPTGASLSCHQPLVPIHARAATAVSSQLSATGEQAPLPTASEKPRKQRRPSGAARNPQTSTVTSEK